MPTAFLPDAETTKDTYVQSVGDTIRLTGTPKQRKFPLELDTTKSAVVEVATREARRVRSQALNEFIGQELSRVKEVDVVFTVFKNNILYVWVVVGKFEKPIREQIYEIQMRIIEEFPMLEFDFYILAPPEGHAPDDLISEADVAFRRLA